MNLSESVGDMAQVQAARAAWCVSWAESKSKYIVEYSLDQLPAMLRQKRLPAMASSSKIKRKEEENEEEEAATIPVEVFNPSEDVIGEVVNEKRRLITYGDQVPGTGTSSPALYYASVRDTMSMSEYSTGWRCVVMMKPLEEAYDIVNLLNSYEHPNILKPYGVWEDYEKDRAHITFPLLDGTLSQLPVEELFHVETVNENTYLQGFSKHGFIAFRQIINVVQYVNGRYGASSGGIRLPLQLGVDRIFYEKIPTGEYHLSLGDFYTRNSNNQPASLRRNFEVKNFPRENWKGVGRCLTTLIGNRIANAELWHLVGALTNVNTTIDDLLWEPALWEAKIKMRFIREIYWCVNSDKTGGRRMALFKKHSLGLQPCINKLGVQYTETNLLGSVTFLRDKIVAHQEIPYRCYPGPKEDIGLDKATIERFVAKENPDYMIKLIMVIRQLNWIKESPLTQSETNYMQQFKTT